MQLREQDNARWNHLKNDDSVAGIELAMIGKIISHCRILSQFGRGMDVVCGAEDLKRHCHVALNWFDELKQKIPTGKR